MAVSLMFGVIVSTALTLIVIPLGCVTARTAMCATMNKGMTDAPVCATAIGLSPVSHVVVNHQDIAPRALQEVEPAASHQGSASLVSEAPVADTMPSQTATMVPSCLPLAAFKNRLATSVLDTLTEVDTASEVADVPVDAVIKKKTTRAPRAKRTTPPAVTSVEEAPTNSGQGLSKRPRRGIKIKEIES
jgi:hypothetical protein